MQEINEYYKAVVIGNSSTGKTNFLNRLDNKGFRDGGTIALGTDIVNCKTRIGEIDVNISIWDTAGQEKYSSLTPSYFNNCHAAFIFYDVNDQNSFDKVKSWNIQIEQSTNDPIVKVLIASKCDMNTRLINTETGKKESYGIGAAYFETSSKDNFGIKEAFEHMANELTINNNKIVVIGDYAAGKSSFIQRFTTNNFYSPGNTTTGISVEYKKTKTDNKIIKVNIWDTAGHIRYLPVIRSYYKKAHGVFIVYDANNLRSFKEVDNRNKELVEISQGFPVKVLIAAKCDLPKKVDTDMGKTKAESIGATYFETSSKENIGIEEAFDYMVKETNKKYRIRPQPTIVEPSPTTMIIESLQKSKNCCYY